MALERLQFAVLRWEDRYDQPDALRSRLQWSRVRMVLLLVGYVALTGLRFRGSDLMTLKARIIWAGMMAAGVGVLGRRLLYIQRRLEQLDAQKWE